MIQKIHGNADFPELRYGAKPLRAIIERLIEDPLMRSRVASAQMIWVKKKHDLRIIAKRLIEYILGLFWADEG